MFDEEFDNKEHSSALLVCVAWWCLGEGTIYGAKKMSCIACLQCRLEFGMLHLGSHQAVR